MIELPLHIFPGGGFDSSILTVVFVGLLAMWWLTESYGFVFIGLVVPGYLASVMIIAPTTAIVVAVECLITYVLVWLLSDVASRAGPWSIFFGRDRFFAFLLMSLIVRLVGELWIWPEAWSVWTELSGFAPNLPGALTSVGLVLVPLAANMFWKVGAVRGIWQLGVPTAMVWAVTSYVLLPLTNLRFSEFQVHYEDVAIDMIASPKAYVIMIVAASLAARANIRFGWDFGGILIPALLAISWFDVTKGLVTLAEAVILAGCAWGAMRLPAVRRWNLEGPRRLVFVFAVGYALKFVLGWTVYMWLPHVRATDFFGFGYLLSSLLALKMLQRRSISLVLTPAVVVSIAGFVAGGLIVSGIGWLAEPDQQPRSSERTVQVASVDLVGEGVRHSVVTGARGHGGEPLHPDELADYERMLSGLVVHRAGRGRLTQTTSDRIDELGLTARWGELDGKPALLLSEPARAFPQPRGWGMLLLRPAGRGPAVLVPDADGQPFRVLASLGFAARLDARAVLFGARSFTPSGRELHPRKSASSPYHIAARRLSSAPFVELEFGDVARAWVGTRVTRDIPLADIAAVVGDTSVEWRLHPSPGLQSSISGTANAAVRLDWVRTLQLAGEMSEQSAPTTVSDSADPPETLAARMESLLLGSERVVARSLLELGSPVSAAEEAVATRGVLQPLLRLGHSPPPAWVERDLLRASRSVAATVGLEIEELRVDESCWWIVRDRGQPLRGWGMTVLRCDGGAPLSVLVPYPLRERSTWRFATALLDGYEGRALTIGAPTRGLDRRPIGDPLTQPTLLSAAHRALNLQGLTSGSAPVWSVEIRGLGAHRDVRTDVIVARDSPLVLGRREPLLGAFVERLRGAGLSVDHQPTSPAYASLRALQDSAATYSRDTAEGRFARFWLSSEYRDLLLSSPDPDSLAWLVQSQGLRSVERLDELEAAGATVQRLRQDRTEFVDIAQRFARTHNPVDLALLDAALAERSASPAVWIEPGAGRAWMVTRTAKGGVFGVRLNLARPAAHLDGEGALEAISAATFERGVE